MAQTFDIRFSSVTGLAALLAVPENPLRWKGDGQLTVDEQGVTVSATSWLPFPRPRRLRFSPTELTQAWREGDAVRLEFRETRGPVLLPLWAKNAESAAEMVRALPTTRTVEFDHASDASRPPYRYDKPLVYSMCAAVALVLVAAFAGMRAEEREAIQASATEASTATFIPDTDTASEVLPESSAALPEPARERPVAVVDPPPVEPVAQHIPPAREPASSPDAPARSRAASAILSGETAPASNEEAEGEPFVPFIPAVSADPGDLVVPIRQNTVAHHTAREVLQWFEKVAAENNEKFAGHLADMDAGRMHQDEFIRALNSLEFRWRNLASGLLASAEARTPELTGFRGTLLSVTNYQSSFLTGYASGLRIKDQEAIAKAYAERERADQAMERARMYLR